MTTDALGANDAGVGAGGDDMMVVRCLLIISMLMNLMLVMKEVLYRLYYQFT